MIRSRDTQMKHNLVKLAYCVKLAQRVSYMRKVRMLKQADKDEIVSVVELMDKHRSGVPYTQEEADYLRSFARTHLSTSGLAPGQVWVQVEPPYRRDPTSIEGVRKYNG